MDDLQIIWMIVNDIGILWMPLITLDGKTTAWFQNMHNLTSRSQGC
jgi:hypothetical protein